MNIIFSYNTVLFTSDSSVTKPYCRKKSESVRHMGGFIASLKEIDIHEAWNFYILAFLAIASVAHLYCELLFYYNYGWR